MGVSWTAHHELCLNDLCTYSHFYPFPETGFFIILVTGCSSLDVLYVLLTHTGYVSDVLTTSFSFVSSDRSTWPWSTTPELVVWHPRLMEVHDVFRPVHDIDTTQARLHSKGSLREKTKGMEDSPFVTTPETVEEGRKRTTYDGRHRFFQWYSFQWQ